MSVDGWREQQIMEQIINLRTPLKLNSFINGRSVSIMRDNPDDELPLWEGSQSEDI